jgi:hypothetical protein
VVLGTGLDALLRGMLGAVAIGVEPDEGVVVVLVNTASSVTPLRALVRRLRPALDGLPKVRIRVFGPKDLPFAVKPQHLVVGPPLEGLRPPGELATGDLSNRLTFEPLSHTYGHLLPLAALERGPDLVAVEGEPRGEQPSARSRPPSQRIPILASPGRATSTPTPRHGASPPVSRPW